MAAAARDAYRASVAAGAPLSTTTLARRFERSPRWAQQRIAEARNHTSGPGVQHGPAHSNGSRPGSPAAGGAADETTGAAGETTGAAPAGGRNRASVRAQRIDTLIVAMVALVAAAASYEHQRGLAVLAGEGDLSWVLPISVDGMMLATSRSILRRRRAGRRVAFLSWFGFALGFAASVAANVAAAEPALVGRLVAAWPPVALFIAYETLAADHRSQDGGT